MNKLYDRIEFHNNTEPALNDSNLNAMSKGIDDIDDRVVELGTAVLETVPELERIAEDIEENLDNIKEAGARALIAEGFSVGQQNGEDVDPDSPYYHNNAKYYSQQTNPTALANMSDVDVSGASAGKVLKYNGQKWEAGEGGGSGGSSVIANPTLSGDESELNGLEVDGTKFKVASGSEKIELTKAEYDALPDTKLTDGKMYFIKDWNEGGSSKPPKFEYKLDGITIVTTGITITGGGYYEWGNVVVVNLNVNITASVNGYTFNGFPKAVVATNVNPIITSINGGNSYPSLWGFINTNGQMQMRVNPASSDLVGKNAIITAQYLKATE